MPTRQNAWLLLFPILGLSLAWLGAQTPAPAPFLPPAATAADRPYPIVYVKGQRKGDAAEVPWPDVANASAMMTPSDIVLLKPDGTETTLVAGNGSGLGDLYVSYDGNSIFYTKYVWGTFGGQTLNWSADIFRVDLDPTTFAVTNTVQLTNGGLSPNRKVDDGTKSPGLYLQGSYPVLNSCPCPLADGRIAFCSNRSMYRPTKPQASFCMQLYVMDGDGNNVEKIGYLTLGSALHPVQLRNGQIMFSSYESQGLRDVRLWSLWAIDPDGTSWGPIFSQLTNNFGFHFHTQLSDGRVACDEYYNLNDDGMGQLFACSEPGSVIPPFGPAGGQNPYPTGYGPGPVSLRFPPAGLQNLTPFTTAFDAVAPLSNPADTTSPRVGKFTMPSAAPNGDLLVVWSPGPVNHDNVLSTPSVNAGIYIIPKGQPITAPSAMKMVRTDPSFNCLWPRALVPYQQIYGIAKPVSQPDLANDGSVHPALPPSTPYGLVGTSSLYKRDSFPDGVVPAGSVTAQWDGKSGSAIYQGLPTAYNSLSNWQGGDCGRYTNDQIHAIRIVGLEPFTDHAVTDRPWRNGCVNNGIFERYRVIGEIPVRKFRADGTQPADPDGNPDTSFLAKIPANMPFTFQMLDADGLVLTQVQTWHQVRPGEMRVNCGGCHAHSQHGTDFTQTAAAAPTYSVFDLSGGATLITSKANDTSGKQWDAANTTGLKSQSGPRVVEWYKTIAPIVQRSCVPCHNSNATPLPGNLNLDSVQPQVAYAEQGPQPKVPGAFAALANNPTGTLGGTKPLRWIAGSRNIAVMQSRRSPLMWRLLGKRTDGWTDADHPTESTPGDPTTLPATWTSPDGKTTLTGQAVSNNADIDWLGKQCPPPGATDASGNAVPPLSDDEKRDFARWIDTGCPINTGGTGGWAQDETPPALYVGAPQRGVNVGPLQKFVLSFADAYTGIDLTSLSVKASFVVDGAAAGTELAPKFTASTGNIWVYNLGTPIAQLDSGTLTVVIADKSGNRAKLVRTFGVAPAPPPPPPPPPLDYTGKLNAIIAELQAVGQTPNPGMPPLGWENGLSQAKNDLMDLMAQIKAPQLKRPGKLPRIPQPWRQSPKGRTAAVKIWQPLPQKRK